MGRGMKRSKAEKNLKFRIAAWEKTCQSSPDGGKGCHKPGSMNGHKS